MKIKGIWQVCVNKIKFHMTAVAILTVALVVGLAVAGDYGIAWDEYDMRRLGYMDYDYITKGGDYKPNPFYGTLAELPLVVLEVKLGITDYKQIFVMRHLVVHLFYLAGAFALYLAVTNVFGKRRFGILALLFYLSFPTLYAHSFFNSKDLPFLSMLSITLFVFVKLLKNPHILWYLFTGICTGLLINGRIIGIIFIPVAALIMAYQIWRNRELFPPLKTVILSLVMLLTACLTLYVSWPLLWNNPVASFMDILQKSSHYTMFGADNLFGGKMINSNSLPFWYLPAWMGITVPLLIQFLGLIGIYGIVKNAWKQVCSRNDILLNSAGITALLLFVLPVFIVMYLHSPLFDGWRHMYFLYLPLIWLAMYGVSFLLSYSIGALRLGLYACIAVHAITTFSFMVRNHPYQNLYFNEIISKKEEHIRSNYDFDFWGTSYREALEFILRDSQKDTVNVLSANSPGRFNQFILNREERDRIVFTDSAADSDYFMSNYRWHPEDYPFRNMVFRKVVSGSTVVGVWKIAEAERNIKLTIDK